MVTSGPKWNPPGYGINSKQVVLSSGRVWKKSSRQTVYSRSCSDWPLRPASSLVYPFDCFQQKRLDIVGAENISCELQRTGKLFFSVINRSVLDKVILVESSPGEKVELAFIHYNATKIDRFRGKEILVCGGKMLGSRTPLYVFDAGIVNLQCKGMRSGSLSYCGYGHEFISGNLLGSSPGFTSRVEGSDSR
ncbi:hypothetical protein TNCV_3866601 [Trichonephila clavipes]|nr:hypothetical protein TNCV_3866601 [Trichonephila clavipes]